MKCERLLALRLNKWAKGSTIILFKRTQDGRPNHRNHTLTDLADRLTSGKLSLAQELDIVSQANTLQNVICSQTHSVFESINLRLRSTFFYQIQH